MVSVENTHALYFWTHAVFFLFWKKKTVVHYTSEFLSCIYITIYLKLDN